MTSEWKPPRPAPVLVRSTAGRLTLADPSWTVRALTARCIGLAESTAARTPQALPQIVSSLPTTALVGDTTAAAAKRLTATPMASCWGDGFTTLSLQQPKVATEQACLHGQVVRDLRGY